jgi:hypothetical protein
MRVRPRYEEALSAFQDALRLAHAEHLAQVEAWVWTFTGRLQKSTAGDRLLGDRERRRGVPVARTGGAGLKAAAPCEGPCSLVGEAVA